MDYKLSVGSVKKLMTGGDPETPVVQILGFKKIAGQGGCDRYRLNISDGLHTHTFAMLATQLNDMILNGELTNFTVIRVDKIVCNNISHKKVFIILELTIIAKGEEVGRKIGNPAQYTDGSASANGSERVNGNSNGQAARPASKPAPEAVVKKETPSKPASSFYSKAAASPATNRNNNNTMAFGAGANVSSKYMPIRDINPYNSKCTIKARVTNKGAVRTWSNSRGEGKLFSMDLLDESGEIRMTGFNTAVDQFYDNIQVNQVYIISNFSAKPANKQFTSLSHDYEISFANDTQVVPCVDADEDIPSMSFAFTDILSIEHCEVNKTIDVIGVCKSVGDLVNLTSKAGKELTKRDITLVDRTKVEVVCTLWGKTAQDFNDQTSPVIAIKGARVGEFQGKNISLMNSSTFLVNPDINEAHVLRGWYDNEGANAETKSLHVRGGGGAAANAPWKMMREVQAVDPTLADAGYYFKSKVCVLALKRGDNTLYRACGEEKCNKKVTDIGDGMYRCEKCMKESPNTKWRLLLSVCFGDASDCIWATCFQEHGETILGEKTDKLGSMWEAGGNEGQQSLDEIVKKASFSQYIVKFRAKLETYNNENRMKYTVIDAQPANYVEYAQAMMADIRENM